MKRVDAKTLLSLNPLRAELHMGQTPWYGQRECSLQGDAISLDPASTRRFLNRYQCRAMNYLLRHAMQRNNYMRNKHEVRSTR